MFEIIDRTLNMIIVIFIGAILLFIIFVYLLHMVYRIKNSKWVIAKLMDEYNYDEDLLRGIVLQVDTITRCKLLGKDREAFLRAVRAFIFKTSGDEPKQ
ncbi:hypothetical protein [Trabulsiella guamensis]|uniref:hypothetical protein n=1 Tax=Trabulsiella guamensis TaxID=158852 RepID=UPI0005712F45|nr:hypothetical protein [Trabulsiella guamensis]